MNGSMAGCNSFFIGTTIRITLFVFVGQWLVKPIKNTLEAQYALVEQTSLFGRAWNGLAREKERGYYLISNDEISVISLISKPAKSKTHRRPYFDLAIFIFH